MTLLNTLPLRGTIVYCRLEQLGEKIHIEVEELVKPVRRGATLRTHRVWQNDSLAGYGAWRHSLEDAIAHADYLVTRYYGAKLAILNQRVSRLEVQNAALRAENEALKEKRQYTEVE